MDEVKKRLKRATVEFDRTFNLYEKAYRKSCKAHEGYIRMYEVCRKADNELEKFGKDYDKAFIEYIKACDADEQVNK